MISEKSSTMAASGVAEFAGSTWMLAGWIGYSGAVFRD
jgi:hypothetical protein